MRDPARIVLFTLIHYITYTALYRKRHSRLDAFCYTLLSSRLFLKICSDTAISRSSRQYILIRTGTFAYGNPRNIKSVVTRGAVIGRNGGEYTKTYSYISNDSDIYVVYILLQSTDIR